MKKILIAGISILLLVLCIVILFKGIQIGSFRIESIKDVKTKSQDLKARSNEAKTLVSGTYDTEKENLQKAAKELEEKKEEYKNKTATIENPEELGVTQTKTYKVEYLWTIIGNYATKQGVTLTLDIAQGNEDGIYNLNFTLVGAYIPTTEFIYNIRNDDNLKFEVKNFKMQVATEGSGTSSSNSANSEQATTDTTNNNNATNTNSSSSTKRTNTNTTKQEPDGKTLQTTFTVENVSIELN